MPSTNCRARFPTHLSVAEPILEQRLSVAIRHHAVSCAPVALLLKPGAELQEGLDRPTNQSAFSADAPLKELYFTSAIANMKQC